MNHPALDAFGDLQSAARDPHVMSCAQCRTELAAQQQVHDLLSSLPDPGPVPPAVVERIEATLRELASGAQLTSETTPVPTADATESTTEATSPPTEATSPPSGEPAAVGATVVPLASAPSARRRFPLVAAAAAVVVLVGGGLVVSQLHPQHGTSSSSSAGTASMQDKSAAGGLAAGAAGRAIASGTNYTRAKLGAQVDQQRGKASDQAAAGPLATPKGLAGCLSALGATAAPSFVDVAKFEGKPAAIIVLPAQDGSREIWVVSPTCSPGNDGTRFFTSVR